jgi:hypothetical protein
MESASVPTYERSGARLLLAGVLGALVAMTLGL